MFVWGCQDVFIFIKTCFVCKTLLFYGVKNIRLTNREFQCFESTINDDTDEYSLKIEKNVIERRIIVVE